MVDHEDASHGKDHKGKTLTDSEILSQAVIFLLAGFDTVSNTFNFIAYNLATNPEHQETLCEEIDTVLERHVSYILEILTFYLFYREFKIILRMVK